MWIIKNLSKGQYKSRHPCYLCDKWFTDNLDKARVFLRRIDGMDQIQGLRHSRCYDELELVRVTLVEVPDDV